MLAGMGDERERIRATVDLFERGSHELRREDSKLRVITWSGPDFRTPSIKAGGLFEDPVAARAIADRCVEALELLGIPVEGLPDGHEAAEPLLAQVAECQEYPRLG